MKFLFGLFVCVGLCIAEPLFSTPPSSNHPQALLTKFQAQQDVWLEGDERKMAHEVAIAYDHMFSPLQLNRTLQTMGDSDIRAMYAASYLALFYTFEDKYLADMQKDYAVLRSRHMETSVDSERMIRAFIQQRELKNAQKFLTTHPDLDTGSLPIVRDVRESSTGPSAIFIDPTVKALYLKNVELGSGPKIIVVGHPLCHFTQNAAKAFALNPRVREAMKKYAVWIAPQDGEIDVDDFRQWNRKYPDLALSIAWKERAWPMIDDWETPTFYFFSNGNLVDKVVGWPKDGNMQALMEGLRKLRLLNAR